MSAGGSGNKTVLPTSSSSDESECGKTTWLDADARIQARGPCIPPTQLHLLQADKDALRRGSMGTAHKQQTEATMDDDTAHPHIKTKTNVTKHIASSFGVAL